MKVLRSERRRGAGRRRGWTLGRVAMWLVGLTLGATVAGELAARYIVGLGDPPLFLLDPEIEYLLAPNQNCRRFGHEFRVNAYSMRSEDFPAHKSPGELRIMVIGDSLVNGGGKIDQSDLATMRLEKMGAAGSADKRIVGNMSAPSWGPPNELAFVKRFGLFDADVLLIVLNSDDYDDVPGLEYIGSAWPRKKPALALQELFGVYVWKAMCRVTGWAPEPPPPARSVTHEEDIEWCHKSFLELVELARSRGAKVAVVQYLKKSELQGKPQVGYDTILAWTKEANVPELSTAELFKHDLDAGAATDPFERGDDIHPNAHGQELLARALEQARKQATDESTK